MNSKHVRHMMNNSISVDNFPAISGLLTLSYIFKIIFFLCFSKILTQPLLNMERSVMIICSIVICANKHLSYTLIYLNTILTGNACLQINFVVHETEKHTVLQDFFIGGQVLHAMKNKGNKILILNLQSIMFVIFFLKLF